LLSSFCNSAILIAGFFWTGKTELAKQVARYLHKDSKKVKDLRLFSVTFNEYVGPFVGPDCTLAVSNAAPW